MATQHSSNAEHDDAEADLRCAIVKIFAPFPSAWPLETAVLTSSFHEHVFDDLPEPSSPPHIFHCMIATSDGLRIRIKHRQPEGSTRLVESRHKQSYHVDLHNNAVRQIAEIMVAIHTNKVDEDSDPMENDTIIHRHEFPTAHEIASVLGVQQCSG